MPALVQSKYEDNAGAVHPIFFSAATQAASSTAPTESVDAKGRAIIGGSRRRAGLHARGVRIARTLGTAPLTFKKYAFIPLLKAADLADPDFQEGVTIEYNTFSWQITSQVGEDSN